MQKKPNGSELLHIALSVVKEELLPALPDEKKYSGLMTANAIAIASRHSQLRGDFETRELNALKSFLKDEGTIRNLNKIFAKRIRKGDFISPFDMSKQAWEILFEITKANVSQSNPKYLEK